MKSEARVQREIEGWLFLNKIFSWRQNSGGNKKVYQGKQRFFHFLRFIFPSRSDILLKPPDIQCLKHGKFISLEIKREGEEPDKHQQNFLDLAEENGGYSFSVVSLEETIKIFMGLFPNETFNL